MKSFFKNFTDDPDPLRREIERFQQEKLTEEDKQEIAEGSRNLEKQAEAMGLENSKQLDRHMMWIAGGALAVVSNIALSTKFIDLQHTWLLVLSFVSFGLCIAIMLSGYQSNREILLTIPRIKNLDRKLHRRLRQVKTTKDPELICLYQAIINQGKHGEHCTWLTNFLNNAGFVSCVVGIFSFVIFGIFNL